MYVDLGIKLLAFRCNAGWSPAQTVNIVRAKDWARRRMTAMLIVSGLISLYMFTHLLGGPIEVAVHVVSDVVKLAIIYLLWVPLKSRQHFGSFR